MKKLVSGILVFVLMSLFCITSFADYQTRDIGSASKSSALTITGTTGKCISKYFDTSGETTKITITQTLEKHVAFGIFSTVSNAEWTKTFNSSSATYSNSKSGLGSGIYRVKSVFTATTSSGQSETITVYSSEGTVN